MVILTEPPSSAGVTAPTALPANRKVFGAKASTVKLPSGTCWNVQDAIDIGIAAKAEEAVLGKHDIDLGIGERHITRLLDNYMHGCLRRYYGVDCECCAISRDHVVVNVRKPPKPRGSKARKVNGRPATT